MDILGTGRIGIVLCFWYCTGGLVVSVYRDTELIHNKVLFISESAKKLADQILPLQEVINLINTYKLQLPVAAKLARLFWWRCD